MPGFVIEYNRRTHEGQVTEFPSSREATAHRLELEAGRADHDVEIAAVSSKSLETLKQTHSRYFGSKLEEVIQRHVDDNFPEGVNVPTDVSEDDAVRVVQEQFQEAGFECPEETARNLVQEAWRRAAE
jgi:hypothetical protein